MKNISLIILITVFFTKSFCGPLTDSGKVGDILMVAAPAYALGMTMMEKDYDGSLQFLEQMVSSQIAVEGIKMLQIEERPNKNDKKSFPSGHSASAFSGAMFVHKRYGWQPAILPYSMALITGWSRVHVKAHYWHDVLAGAAVSGLFTWIFVDEYKGNLWLEPGPDSVSLSFVKKF